MIIILLSFYRILHLLEFQNHVNPSFVASLNSSYIDAISDIYPNPHGTITIEWENEKSEMLSLEIGETNYSYFIKYNNKDPKFVNGQDIMPSIQAIALELDELLVENSPLFFF